MKSKLRERIEASGLKHRWIAEKAAITPTYLSLILNGKRNPSSSVMSRIKRAIRRGTPA